MFLNPKPKEQSNIIRAIPTPPPLTTTERDNPVRQLLDQAGGFLRRNRTYAMGGMLAGLLAAAVVELAVTPHYRATIQILIGPTDLKLVEKSVVPAAQTPDANVMQVETETRVLISDRVLRRVVRREHLTDDPEFQHGGLQLAGFVDALRASIGTQADPSKSAIDPEIDAIRQLQRNITAKRTERTYVVDLTVETSSPELSARIANAIGAAYLDEQGDARAEQARRSSDSLGARLNEQRERVTQAEEQVERYKAQHNIINASGRSVDDQQLTELNNQLITARGRTAEAKAKYEQVQQLRRGKLDEGSNPEAVQSTTLGLLRDQYGTISRQEANLAAELGSRHPRVIEARAQLARAQQQISDEIARIAEASRIDYERALANETALATNLATLKQRSMDTSLAFVKLREFEREAEASRAVYESFLVRTREIREQERLDTANVRVLSDAEPPRSRSWPPRRLVLLPTLLMLGVLGGIGLAYLVELLRRPRFVSMPIPNEV